jgi:hypothetical protein
MNAEVLSEFVQCAACDDLINALRSLADAADDVGVRHFDSDDLPPAVQKMQEATQAARVTLGEATC